MLLLSEDDLRVIAKHGYGGALSTDHEQQARAVSLFIADLLAARRSANDDVAVKDRNTKYLLRVR